MPRDSIGREGFIARHRLWTAEQVRAAAELAGSEALDAVRLSFADQHGVLRGKSVVGDGLGQALRSGCSITTTLLAKDTSHRTVYPVWTAGGGFGMAEMTGAADCVMVPDPTTFRVLPWLERTGWVLCDLYFPDGRPVPFSTRALARRVLADLQGQGYELWSGLEVEFHVFRLRDPKLEPAHATQPGEAAEFGLLTQGFQYLTESRLDELEPVLELLRGPLAALGLGLRSMEAEFGPSQCELTFHPAPGIEPADQMVLLRSAVKQILRRHGYLATFMCRPQGANLFASGWHLHQSLRELASGANAFEPRGEGALLSPLGRHWVAGLLEHARAACAFTTPTINGYKRYRPFTLAPDRAVWGRDNRGAMLRVIGGAGDPNTRVENRVGEPGANPYLYLASQAVAGRAGLAAAREPGTAADAPYDAPADPLPRSLAEALAALRASDVFRAGLGSDFVDYFLHIKEAEVARFLSEVTDWEQREYLWLL